MDSDIYQQVWDVMQEVAGRAAEMLEEAIDPAKEAADNTGRQLGEEAMDEAERQIKENVRVFLTHIR